ncbi:MAG TPA: peptidase M23, partial [Ruthenibacterium lactatiformans]|nr:peptidase M23 [Ruthenibacterium lactatiformans]
QGQLIGYVGRTGRAYGYHLHFEANLNGAPVDVRDYLG